MPFFGLQDCTFQLVILVIYGERMHDGAVAHFSHAVRDVLNNTYHDQWIGRGGPTAIPPCSPDLNYLDFYLWGLLKALVYVASVDNEEALHHRIVDACQDYLQLLHHL
jgi:hypothetical protein